MTKVEYYSLRPSLKQHFGRKVTKALKFDEWTDDKKVHQVMNNGILTTHVKDERVTEVIANGEAKQIKTSEKSTIVQEIPSGVVLIWDENMGYVIPPYEMATLEEIETDLLAMKEVYKETEIKDECKGTKN